MLRPRLLLMTLACLALTGLAPDDANATEYLDVVGTVSFTDANYECHAPGICGSCAGGCDACGSPDGASPAIVFGYGNANDLWSSGTISGGVSMQAVIDGVVVPNAVLPTGSFYRIGLTALMAFCGAPCGSGTTCGVLEYHIGNAAGVTSGSTFIWIDLAVNAEGTGVGFPFTFTFCNLHVSMGMGCNQVGSYTQRARLVTPAPVNAHVFPGGGSIYDFPSVGVEFLSSPGGIVTAAEVPGTPPPGFAGQAIMSYWDIKATMSPGSFSAMLRLPIDPVSLPAGVDPHTLVCYQYDSSAASWAAVPSVYDGTATLTCGPVDHFSFFVVATNQPLPTKRISWGRMKSLYE